MVSFRIGHKAVPICDPRSVSESNTRPSRYKTRGFFQNRIQGGPNTRLVVSIRIGYTAVPIQDVWSLSESDIRRFRYLTHGLFQIEYKTVPIHDPWPLSESDTKQSRNNILSFLRIGYKAVPIQRPIVSLVIRNKLAALEPPNYFSESVTMWARYNTISLLQINPLTDMPILGSSNSTAKKDMMSKIGIYNF